MKNLFDLGNQYIRESDWKDLALVKFCLCAMGVLIGAGMPEKYRKTALAAAAGAFAATYIPLMAKFFEIALRPSDPWATRRR